MLFFFFRTIVSSETYTLCFQLFGGVRPEEVWHVNLAREIKVVMPKTLKCKNYKTFFFAKNMFLFINHYIHFFQFGIG